jgi:hypothetical protein
LSLKIKTQSGSLRGNGTNHVPQSPLITRSILRKKKDEKPKRVISLEEPSLAMIACFKIEAT